jgi:hypothetical protein
VVTPAVDPARDRYLGAREGFVDLSAIVGSHKGRDVTDAPPPAQRVALFRCGG